MVFVGILLGERFDLGRALQTPCRPLFRRFSWLVLRRVHCRPPLLTEGLGGPRRIALLLDGLPASRRKKVVLDPACRQEKRNQKRQRRPRTHFSSFRQKAICSRTRFGAVPPALVREATEA